MPEGPEVRRAADTLNEALSGKPVVAFSARTKAAKAYLNERPGAFVGQTVDRVWSHGKILVGQTSAAGDAEPGFFASHFMMWGRWHVVAPDDEMATTRDRRERARIEVADAVALLFSAPVFEVGTGDPYAHVAHLDTLGPDVLPLDGDYDAAAVRARMAAHADRTIGAALLDQTILAGVGNYLRAEILFECRMDPWRLVGEMDEGEWACLDREIPHICGRAYQTGGRTISDAETARLNTEAGMTYNEPQEWSTRHAVFRRTNLPCLRCDGVVRQKRQITRVYETDDGPDEKTRIVYFCPSCQGTTVKLKPAKPRTPAADRAADAAAADTDV